MNNGMNERVDEIKNQYKDLEDNVVSDKQEIKEFITSMHVNGKNYIVSNN